MNSSMVPVIASLMSVAFLGSWHCGAMCGPIAAAFGRERSLVYYHFGRFISYVSCGALAGFIGHTFSSVLDVRVKAIGFIILALLLAISITSLQILPIQLKRCPILMANRGSLSQLLFGMSSVLMPCGWLWSFVAAAAATSSPYAGALVMGCLWTSSIPALSLASAYFRSSLKQLPEKKRMWVNWILVASGFYSLTMQFFFHH